MTYIMTSGLAFELRICKKRENEMPSPIALVDASYLKGIVLNKDNIPVAVALARLQSLYDLYIAPQVLADYGDTPHNPSRNKFASSFISNSRAWRNYSAEELLFSAITHRRVPLSPRYFGARFANIRCNVRRCMLRRRAVSETLRLHSS